MLPFNELPPSLLKELGLYVKVNTSKILEYAFVDIAQSNKDYNTHLIWHDSTAWYVAHDIYVFTKQDKFEWCYFSADVVFSIEEIKTKLKQLKFNYTEAVKRYKESIQNKRLSKLSEDFND
jgi:hypothetical protein